MVSKRFLIVPLVFIGGQDAAARSDHGLGDFVEYREIYRAFLDVRINRRLIMPNCRPKRE